MRVLTRWPPLGAAMLLALCSVANAQQRVHHYVFYGRDRDAMRRDSLSLHSRNFEGAQVAYTWRELEPAKDRYDFTHIRNDLALLAEHHKKLWIQLQDVSFSASSMPVPEYLHTEPEYHGGAAQQYNIKDDDDSSAIAGGWAMRRWDPAVQRRFHRLLAALGEAFDGRVEGINFAETSVTFGSSGRLWPSGFTNETYRDGVIANLRALKAAFPTSVTLIYGNFMPGEWRPSEDRGYLSAVYQAAREFGVGVGGPDVMPHRRGHTKGSHPLLREAAVYVPVGMAVQDGNLAEKDPATGERVTARQLLDYATNNLRASYIFWGTEEPYFTGEVVGLVEGRD